MYKHALQPPAGCNFGRMIPYLLSNRTELNLVIVYGLGQRWYNITLSEKYVEIMWTFHIH